MAGLQSNTPSQRPSTRIRDLVRLSGAASPRPIVLSVGRLGNSAPEPQPPVPELQRVGQVVGFLTRHRGFEIASTTLVAPMSEAFIAEIRGYALHLRKNRGLTSPLPPGCASTATSTPNARPARLGSGSPRWTTGSPRSTIPPTWPGCRRSAMRSLRRSSTRCCASGWPAWPHPFTPADRAAGYRYQLSIPQAVTPSLHLDTNTAGSSSTTRKDACPPAGDRLFRQPTPAARPTTQPRPRRPPRQALLSTICVFRLLPRGFTNRDLRIHLAPQLGLRPEHMTSGQTTYDLRRLRVHGLIEPRLTATPNLTRSCRLRRHTLPRPAGWARRAA